jgi:hypothetical protein
MKKTISKSSPYLLSALLGAIGGGILVIVATKAIPTLMTRMMTGMMQNMMAQMGACDCNPKEM